MYDCLSTADDSKNPTECLFCNYHKDLFVVGDFSNEGKCCKKGTVPGLLDMCE